jgi:hypothetical protein
MNEIDSFLEHIDVKEAPPASSEEIEAVERLFGAELPDALKTLWSRAGGAMLNSLHGEMLGPTAVCRFIGGMAPEWREGYRNRGLVLPCLI